MVHCGYDPSGALSPKISDGIKNAVYNFGTKPAPYPNGDQVTIFNGCTIGKGHLAEAQAAIKAGASEGGGCSSEEVAVIATAAAKN